MRVFAGALLGSSAVAPTPGVSLRRYWLLVVGLLALFLGLFALVEALGVPLLADPWAALERGGAVAAALGVSLLVADVFIPVPSSLVMIAHGPAGRPDRVDVHEANPRVVSGA